MQAITLNEISKDFLTMMDGVNNNHEPLVITHENHKSIVMMSLDDFNGGQETAYLNRSSSNTKDLLQAVEDIKKHKNLQHHQLIDTL